MLEITTVKEMREYSRLTRNAGLSISLVPTMGYLHAGHISLVREARSRGNRVVVSIFVNPLQFNDPDDLENYPRNPERDAGLLREEDVDVLFMPEPAEVFPDQPPGIRLSYPSLIGKLCGAHRPGHFEGVLLIVHNLLQWVIPDYAIFGLKDYQQYLLIKRMSAELAFETDIIAAPLIREESGLALSSRNVRIPASALPRALTLSQTLNQIKSSLNKNPLLTCKSAREIMQDSLNDGLTAEDIIDYADLYDPGSLDALPDSSPVKNSLAALAVHIGPVRLIDNMLY